MYLRIPFIMTRGKPTACNLRNLGGRSLGGSPSSSRSMSLSGLRPTISPMGQEWCETPRLRNKFHFRDFGTIRPHPRIDAISGKTTNTNRNGPFIRQTRRIVQLSLGECMSVVFGGCRKSSLCSSYVLNPNSRLMLKLIECVWLEHMVRTLLSLY